MKVFVFSDIHGQGKLFKMMINHMENCGEEFFCFCLGDACDRGPDGYEIMKYLLEHKDNFCYLKGNHEDMFVRAVKEFCDIAREEGYSPAEYAKLHNYDYATLMCIGIDLQLYMYNGGADTFKSWIEDGCPFEIIHELENLPLRNEMEVVDEDTEETVYIYDMCHAGCTMEDWNEEIEDSLLWDRDHFSQRWCFETDDIPHILIHGHTPIAHMPTFFRKENGMRTTTGLRYNHGSKINIDSGAFHTGTALLFDIGKDEFVPMYEGKVI